MTKPHAFPSPPRLRPDSPRALNQLRLLWLLGWTAADIAAHFRVNRTTIWRRLRVHSLRGPELPDERERLAEAEARAMLTDALIRGDKRAAQDLAGLLPKMNGPMRPKAAQAEIPMMRMERIRKTGDALSLMNLGHWSWWETRKRQELQASG